MIETDPRLLQGRSTAPPQISVSVAGTQTECSPSQEPANRKATLARLQSAVAELLCTINIRRRGNRTLSEQRIWIAAEQVDLELRDVGAETPVLPTARSPLRGGLPLWRMRKTCDFIDANLSSTLRICDLASNANLSHSHFVRAFRRSFGESPHAYIVRMRVQRAPTMLLTGVAPLQQIALDADFLTNHTSRGSSLALWGRGSRRLAARAPPGSADHSQRIASETADIESLAVPVLRDLSRRQPRIPNECVGLPPKTAKARVLRKH